jgi:hypothetical protein
MSPFGKEDQWSKAIPWQGFGGLLSPLLLQDPALDGT